MLRDADAGPKRYAAGARASLGFLATVAVLGLSRARMARRSVVTEAAPADDAAARQALWDALDDPSALLQFVAAGDAGGVDTLQDDLFFPMDCDSYGATPLAARDRVSQ